LVVYYILPRAWRNGFILISSLLFYAWGEPVYLLLMLFSIAFGWLAGIALDKSRGKRRLSLVIVTANVLASLGILGFFKYGNFIVENLNRIASLHLSLIDLPLPLGISFYTFQILSYTIDVHRGEGKAQISLVNFGTYIAMFPQLIAGPIVRYNSIALQLTRRRETLSQFGEGVGLFVIGLAKKVLLANNIGLLWGEIKTLPSGGMTLLAAWTGIAAFGLQLYFDFSAYSDMAVGMGRMLGFDLERNFNYPYLSLSITDFWRRWHISLGAWFREYLYIPLGGSRQGRIRTILNLLIVWTATGLWHGASWNYVLWGLYYFLFLLGERFLWSRILEKAPKWMKRLYVLFVVMIGWVLFVHEDLPDIGYFLTALFGGARGGVYSDHILYLLSSWRFVILSALIGATPMAANLMARFGKSRPMASAFARSILTLAGLLFSTAYLVDSSFNPFLYFRF
ncbi:MAG: MBOAT family protein, partial [Clostridiales bacterium]|nr:MBOAT family protein [Clostridiales bacterium]